MLCIAGLSSIDAVFLLIIIFDERKVDAAEAIGTIIAGKLRPGFSTTLIPRKYSIPVFSVRRG